MIALEGEREGKGVVLESKPTRESKTGGGERRDKSWRRGFEEKD